MNERILYPEYPCDEQLLENQKYLKLLKKYYSLQKKLRVQLTKEQLKILDDLLDIAEEMELVAAGVHFEEGYKSGLRDGNKR